VLVAGDAEWARHMAAQVAAAGARVLATASDPGAVADLAAIAGPDLVVTRAAGDGGAGVLALVERLAGRDGSCRVLVHRGAGAPWLDVRGADAGGGVIIRLDVVPGDDVADLLPRRRRRRPRALARRRSRPLTSLGAAGAELRVLAPLARALGALRGT